MARPASSGAAAALVVVLLSSTAYASGVDDGNAGLQALNSGQYDQAIALFTRALSDRGLAPEDQEFAYASRGKAYLGKGDAQAASADFAQALRLKPDDADAKSGLEQAAAARTEEGSAPVADRRWGVLARLAGKCWVFSSSEPKAYECLDWNANRTELVAKAADRHTSVLGKYRADPVAGILFGETSGSMSVYSTVDVSGDAAVLSCYTNNTPRRETVTLTGPTTGSDTIETYTNGAWVTATTYSIAEISRDAIANVRWAKIVIG